MVAFPNSYAEEGQVEVVVAPDASFGTVAVRHWGCPEGTDFDTDLIEMTSDMGFVDNAGAVGLDASEELRHTELVAA